MPIAAQTRSGTHILIEESPELPAGRLKAYVSYRQQFPDNLERRAATATYNCYGMALVNRRGWVSGDDIDLILNADGYRLLRLREEAAPGDIVVYNEEGQTTHVAIIMEFRQLAPGGNSLPWVLSKWGAGPEYLHNASRSPFGPSFVVMTERP
jgi:hypothetical protein